MDSIPLTSDQPGRSQADSSTALLPGTKGYRDIRGARWRRENPVSFCVWAAFAPVLWVSVTFRWGFIYLTVVVGVVVDILIFV